MASVDELAQQEANGEKPRDEVQQAAELTKQAEMIVRDDGPNALLMDSARFHQAWRLASLMARLSSLPETLSGVRDRSGFRPFNPETVKANCFRIINQAFRWQVDPFALLDVVYIVHGKLGWEGKLVAAIVNSRAPIQGNLNYRYEGSGKDRTCYCYATLEGEDKAREVEVVFSKAVTYEKDGKTVKGSWSDVDQKLSYNAAIKWARRHCPEVILGVLTEDDIDRIESDRKEETPRFSSVEIPDGNHVKLPDPAKPGEAAKYGTPAESVQIGDSEDQQEPEGDTGEIRGSESDAPMWAGALSEELRSCETIDDVEQLRKSFEKNVEPGDEDGFNLLHDMCDEAAKYIGAQA